MIRSGILITIFTGTLLVGCGGSPTSPVRRTLPRVLSEQEVELITSENIFGLNLFQAITDAEGGDNIFISPLSISMALGMTLNGAAGETYTVMKETLELAGLTEEEINQAYRSLINLLTNLDPKVQFEIANSIWYRDSFPIEQPFIDVNQEYFDAEVRGLNFNNPGAADIINAWVVEKTNGKIEEIVEKPIDPMTMMFLINAIYFKGDWTYRFRESATEDRPFTLADGSTRQVPMMFIEDVKLGRSSGSDYQAVDLAYGDSLFTMTIILPDSGVDIDAFIASFGSEQWDSLSDRWWHEELALFGMPKFELEYEITLNDILIAMGMGIAFDDLQANFTRMYLEENQPNLFINEVKHKTFIKVDEKGTEAAAVTSVEMGYSSGPETMIVDRPFIFIIRERCSGTILFIGKITDPGV